jgi:hypothetical protein
MATASGGLRHLTDEAFTTRICVAWANRMGVYFDTTAVQVRRNTEFAGRGIFAKKKIAAGDLLAMIPAAATLRSIDLFATRHTLFRDVVTVSAPAIPTERRGAVAVLSTVDSWGAGLANPGDPTPVLLKSSFAEEADMASAFGRGFQVIARGCERTCDDLPQAGLLDSTRPTVVFPQDGRDEQYAHLKNTPLPPLSAEEREWWQLAMVLALHRRRGSRSDWRDYIDAALPATHMMDVTQCFQHQISLLSRGRLPSPSTSMKPPSRNESPLITPLTPPLFTKLRADVNTLESIRNGYAWRLAALFNANLNAVVGGAQPMTTCTAPASRKATYLRPSELRWSMDVVTSRANNFSFVNCTDRPRPYGVTEEPVPGACATLCPFFDLLNHSQSMNVLVADVAMGASASQEADEANGGLVLAALNDVAEGEELTYIYNAPTRRDETTGYRLVDVAGCIGRWGFLPEPPLT